MPWHGNGIQSLICFLWFVVTKRTPLNRDVPRDENKTLAVSDCQLFSAFGDREKNRAEADVRKVATLTSFLGERFEYFSNKN